MEHVALITGAGRGIGASIAEYLGARGIVALVAARTTADCEAVAGQIVAAGGRAHAIELDVTGPDSIEDAVDTARTFGEVDWLINNAGIAQSAPLLKQGELYAKHLEVNFHGPRRLVEALAPDMLERGYGRVVNIASSAALHGYAYVGAYVASKHALLGYTRSAALELGSKGMHFHAVCPHYVDSPMTAQSIANIVEKTGRSQEEAAQFFAEQNPGGRLVQPAEIAKVVYSLCAGDENGQVVELDGSGA